MKRLITNLLVGGLAYWWPTASQAQVGDGLRGEYYAGVSFAHLNRTRTDGVLKFNWRGTPPISGVAPERFTVRWTGWLVPPTTGRYVLHLDVDDGATLWLDDRNLIDAWRGQSLHSFEAPVQLEAGHPYALRLDYLQYAQLAHIHLSWELPEAPEVLQSWRTLWGITEAPLLGGTRRIETIPTQYLFTHWPAAFPKRSALLATSAGGTATRVVPAGFRPAPMRVKLSEVRVKSPSIKPSKPANKRPLTTQRADTMAARLAKGQALTLRTLYFEQSKADLPLPVQARLDTLAEALRRYPSLRLEVQGHTDNQGDSALNRQLSQRRAEAVCRYLASRGVPPRCLRPVGMGGSQPVADNRLPAERPRNRRVVLRPLP
jgi:outer membrane protein OmpA-like peptidoglycan-associated protein